MPTQRNGPYLIGVMMVAACTASSPDRAATDTVKIGPAPIVSRPSEALQRYVLVSLNGNALPTLIYTGDSVGGVYCADWTHAARYELTRGRWVHEGTVSSNCPPVERRVVTDSGPLELSGDAVVFRYGGGGAVQGRRAGDTLIVEDGGPTERYIRAP
jgi:hypothetical protein